jgi:type IV pilus assembly protein PilC
MLFSTAYPLDALVTFCRTIRHGLSAGLSVVDVFRQQADRGPRPLRPLAGAVLAHLETGDSLEDALKREGQTLPPLFRNMAAVGEQSGHLPETFRELERYYQLQSTLRKRFLADITWPLLEFFGAVGVIALMLLVLGLIAPAGQAPLDPLGLGLTGPRGALIFLGMVFGVLAALWVGWNLLARMTRQKAAVDRFLLRVPVIGPCLEALALARFCLAMRLTLGAGLPVKPALKRSLEASGNAAYPARFDEASDLIRQGEDLTSALRALRVFPEDFLDVVSNAEEGGRTPEVMEQQSEHYQEEASRRMAILTRAAGFGVWAFVAVLLIVCIFRIFFTYIRLIDPATYGL